MAIETKLVALSWHDGRYEVVAQVTAQVDTNAMMNDGLFHDVSEDSGYLDEAAIVQKKDFARYLLPESNPWHKAATLWYASLPTETMFIVVHRAEWDSGRND